MTLVAAFPLRGIPALIGDFLLTDNQENVNNNFLPTKPNLQNVKPGAGRRRIAGFRKKIHKINGKLIVGFTGDLNQGIVLIKGLVKQFTNKVPTLIELQEFLDKVVVKNKDRLNWLAGFVKIVHCVSTGKAMILPKLILLILFMLVLEESIFMM